MDNSSYTITIPPPPKHEYFICESRVRWSSYNDDYVIEIYVGRKFYGNISIRSYREFKEYISPVNFIEKHLLGLTTQKKIEKRFDKMLKQVEEYIKEQNEVALINESFKDKIIEKGNGVV
jgi:hypothetical protein